MKIWWFSKSRRAQNKDDYETWIPSGIAPTLSAFDRGDGRETVIIFYGHRVNDLRIQGNVINTLQARMGPGGLNMPLITYPIQGTSIGRSDNAGPNGKGFGDANDPMFTLDSGAGANAVANTSTVRRLTPVECERLQGFPDGWTECVSDSQRYKQMGNAVTVNVVAWIGGKL